MRRILALSRFIVGRAVRLGWAVGIADETS